VFEKKHRESHPQEPLMPSSILSLPSLLAVLLVLAAPVAHARSLVLTQAKTITSVGSLERTAPVAYQLSFLRFLCIGPVEYHVQDGAIDGDGSSDHPFESIGEALDRAEEERACEATVIVGPGTYRENLSIRRDTHIFGAGKDVVALSGTIENSGPHELWLYHLTMKYIYSPGGIIVENAGATTILYDVLIDRAALYGVRQHGGTLAIYHSEIRYTYQYWDDLAEGTALFLSGGVEAHLFNVSLLGNGSAGLVASDDGTVVSATSLDVRNNSSNFWFRDEIGSSYADGYAAVEVRDGARLFASDYSIVDNRGTGLFVHDDAEAFLSSGTITGTQSVSTSNGDKLGSNIVVKAAILELEDFTSSWASLAGLQLLYGRFSGSRGAISQNVIGVHNIQSDDSTYDYFGCIDEIVMAGNDRNFDGTTLAVPDPLADLDGASADPANCPSVGPAT
jgi:hypothetical protein